MLILCLPVTEDNTVKRTAADCLSCLYDIFYRLIGG
jgi:hypothetical protein